MGIKRMFVLRFTQNLLKDMKVAPEELEDVPSLLSWHVNIIRLNNRKHILFVNDLSRLSIIIDGVRTAQLNRLMDKFHSTLLNYLVSEGIEQELIDSYMRNAVQMKISKTNNRSVLSTMTEITLYSTGAQKEFENMEEHLKWLNRSIYKPIDYNKPINVFKEAVRLQ
jgi:hypothetical protein